MYGAPSSGKTHTLVGQGHVTSFAAGIVPQAVEAILSHLRIVPKDKFQLQATLSGEAIITLVYILTCRKSFEQTCSWHCCWGLLSYSTNHMPTARSRLQPCVRDVHATQHHPQTQTWEGE